MYPMNRISSRSWRAPLSFDASCASSTANRSGPSDRLPPATCAITYLAPQGDVVSIWCSRHESEPPLRRSRPSRFTTHLPAPPTKPRLESSPQFSVSHPARRERERAKRILSDRPVNVAPSRPPVWHGLPASSTASVAWPTGARATMDECQRPG